MQPCPPASPPAPADELIALLARTLRVVTTPMVDAVARLDICGPRRVLYLDSGSSTEDLRWALDDVLRVVRGGPGAARWATPAPRLRLVADDG